ncbi:hypothetical protein F5X99DRAFT_364189 [Biscogniauxia marginata]|nr:hypothetical protein F5X99DRAFT_364189 [Biscogniauxia marginata]
MTSCLEGHLCTDHVTFPSTHCTRDLDELSSPNEFLSRAIMSEHSTKLLTTLQTFELNCSSRLWGTRKQILFDSLSRARDKVIILSYNLTRQNKNQIIMPSRRILPKLSIFSSKQPSTSTFSPPSPSHSAKPSTSTPMSPPARLHLRNILPSSPDALPTPPPPPRQPYAWLWQCHSCHTVYRLGCTSRCLVCSHSYCVSANPPTTTGRSRKRRRAPGMCTAEFDYSGWAEWGAWRRKVLGLEAVGPTGARERERAFVDKTHNCWNDCDYPSECHHERYRLAAEAAQKSHSVDYRAEEPESLSLVASVPRSPDDDLPLNEALELAEEEDEQKSPKSPLSQTSFFGDEVDTEQQREQKRKEEEKAWWTDAVGQEKQRKIESQQKVKQLTGGDVSELYKTDSHSPKPITPSRRNSTPSSSSSGSSSRPTARSLTDREIWEDWDSDDDSDSESDSEDGFRYDSSSRTSLSESEDDDDDDVEKHEDPGENEKWNEPLLAPFNVRHDARGQGEPQTKDDDDDADDLAALLQARQVYLRLGESI